MADSNKEKVEKKSLKRAASYSLVGKKKNAWNKKGLEFFRWFESLFNHTIVTKFFKNKDVQDQTKELIKKAFEAAKSKVESPTIANQKKKAEIDKIRVETAIKEEELLQARIKSDDLVNESKVREEYRQAQSKFSEEYLKAMVKRGELIFDYIDGELCCIVVDKEDETPSDGL